MDSCLDDDNGIPLKVIASFSASRFALPSIPLIFLHSLVRSVFWSMVSTKSLSITAGIGSSWSLCRPVGMWCDAALVELYEISSHLF